MPDSSASRERRGFFDQIAPYLDDQSRRYVGGWDSTGPDRILRWLEGNAVEFYAGSLKQPYLHTFPQLLAAYQRIKPHEYRPQDFAHESLPAPAWVGCANKYRTLGRLLKAIQERPGLVRRDHLYLAFLLGIIDARELERVPPKVHKGPLHRPRRRRKLKAAR
ncbi:MAG TPA: hypothetical protein VFY28_00180 [Candidatus Paceibacterota bacterium]|nr:hypothetical protein [Candidatus Paceibacterota bacterium]